MIRRAPSADRSRRAGRWLRVVVPLSVVAAVIGAWEAVVRLREIPTYLLPAPSVIARTMIDERADLLAALGVTLQIMAAALALAVAGGVLLALLFRLSPVLEMSLFPPAIVLQVTPLIAIAPLLSIWLGDSPRVVVLLCAWIVAFFPILSNTLTGLRGVDHNLRDLLRLYGATPWQRLRLLHAPAALPYFLAGLKIAANLALVGAIVAEFVVGAGGVQTGLASTILESSYRLDTPKTFAAITLVSATGVLVYFSIHALSERLLRPWHDSARRPE